MPIGLMCWYTNEEDFCLEARNHLYIGKNDENFAIRIFFVILAVDFNYGLINQ